MGLLTGKAGIVSGSSRGIGKAVAGSMLGEGATVWISGRDQERLESARGELSGTYGDRVRSFRGDLAETRAIRDMLGQVVAKGGRLDTVVANIGSGRSKMGWDVEDDLWQESFAINFFPAVKLAREALRVMIPQGAGSIIFISSIAGVETIAAPVPYASAKAALLGYMKNTASLAARHGIRMNAVSPGNIFFEDGTWDRKMKEDPSAVEKYIREQVPLQRFGTPEDIGRLVCFLASDAASFITGANMVIDGGQTRSL